MPRTTMPRGEGGPRHQKLEDKFRLTPGAGEVADLQEREPSCPPAATQQTTAIHTFVHYGGAVHMLVSKYSVDELKQMAFMFVEIRRELGDADPDDYDSEKQREEFQAAWHTYDKVTKGTCKATELPELGVDELPDRRAA